MNKRRLTLFIIFIVVIPTIAIAGFLYTFMADSPNTDTDSRQDTEEPRELEAERLAVDPNSALGKSLANISDQLKDYGFVVATRATGEDGSSSWTQLSDADAAQVDRLAPYLVEEYKKLPTDLIKKSELDTVFVVKDLKVSGTARNATPGAAEDVMTYDAPGLVASESGYARRVVSHEYWHYLDYKINSTYRSQDPEWQDCNPADFRYGAGGQTAYSQTGFSNTFHPRDGFISQYATFAIEEDRGELFSWLVFDPARTKGLNDNVINCKIDRLNQELKELSPAAKL